MTVHFNAAVHGKALSVFIQGQVAGDLPVPGIAGIDAGIAKHRIRVYTQREHRHGVIFIDDIAGGDHIAGHLARFEAGGTDGGSLGQCQRAGVQRRCFRGDAAVQRVTDLSFPGKDHADIFYTVINAPRGLHKRACGYGCQPAGIFLAGGGLGKVEDPVLPIHTAHTGLIGHIVNMDIVAQAVTDMGHIHPAFLPVQGKGGIDSIAGQLGILGTDDQHRLSGCQCFPGQLEQKGLVRAVGNGIFRQINGLLGDVFQFDPVIIVTVCLHQIAVVGRHDLPHRQCAPNAPGLAELLMTLLGIGKAGGKQTGLHIAAVLLQLPHTVICQGRHFQPGDLIGHRTGQQQTAAVFGKGKTRFSGHALLPCAGDHGVFSRGDRQAFDPPFHGILGIIGQVAAIQNRILCAGIVKLDPVAQQTAAVGDGAAVGALHLADHHLHGLDADPFQPLAITRFRVGKARCAVGAGCIAAVFLPNIGGVGSHGRYLALGNAHIGAVVKIDGLPIPGNTKIRKGLFIGIGIAPDHRIAPRRQHCALGEGVANGHLIIRELIIGKVNSTVGGVMQLYVIQQSALPVRISAVAGQHLADHHAAGTAARLRRPIGKEDRQHQCPGKQHHA